MIDMLHSMNIRIDFLYISTMIFIQKGRQIRMKRFKDLNRLVNDIEKITLREYTDWAQYPDTAYCVVETVTLNKDWEIGDTISVKLRVGCKSENDKYFQTNLNLDDLDIKQVLNKRYMKGYISCKLRHEILEKNE